METMRDVRIRIRSVSQSLKITTAMKLISTAKLRKARAKLEDARPYFEAMAETLFGITKMSGLKHNKWFDERKNKAERKVATLIITSDRGLAGSFNGAVIRFAAERCPEGSIIVPIGNIGRRFFMSKNYTILQDFPLPSKDPSVRDAREIAYLVSQLFITGRIDEFRVVYTKMVSTVKQVPQMIKLLPFDPSTFEPARHSKQMEGNFNYSPDEDGFFDYLAPKYIKGMLYGALVESFASEQIARMTAMDAASKNAKQMIEQLQLLYNRARQASITREVTEIVAGAAALEG